MATVDIPTELRVENLLPSVKQLSPVELHEFWTYADRQNHSLGIKYESTTTSKST